MYYLFGEDLAPGLVGPFKTREAAEEHLEFQRQRGDAAVLFGNAIIIPWDELDRHENAEWSMENNLCSPEEDRAQGVMKEVDSADPAGKDIKSLKEIANRWITDEDVSDEEIYDVMEYITRL